MVDMDGRFGYTYGELWLMTVGLVHNTQKLVDIDHVGRFIQKKSVDGQYRLSKWTYTQKNSKKMLIFETNRKDVHPMTSTFFLDLGFDTVTLEFWVPLDKAQVFADGCKNLFEK